MPHTPFDYLRVVLAGITTEMGWQEAPDLQEWVDRSRLNLMSGLGENDDRATVREQQDRFFAALFPAIEKLQAFAAQATPRERARMFEAAASAVA
jgi:hypothetical protein